MVNRDRVAAKVSELSDRVSRVKQHCPASPADLAANRDALDLVSFNLMLAVQACADVASHMIADEGWPAAQPSSTTVWSMESSSNCGSHLRVRRSARIDDEHRELAS
jgi:uncharacterized protein YutE (UPF0331/DUF86 family)